MKRTRMRIDPTQAVLIASTLLGILVSALLVDNASEAAFTGWTGNPTESWSAGTVSLTDDDGGNSPVTGTAMFSATGLSPASTPPPKCIAVTYGGSLSAPVKLYGRRRPERDSGRT